MPLLPGKSRDIISQNIDTEMNTGNLTAKTPEEKQKQAIAIAYSKAGLSRNKPKKKRGMFST